MSDNYGRCLAIAHKLGAARGHEWTKFISLSECLADQPTLIEIADHTLTNYGQAAAHRSPKQGTAGILHDDHDCLSWTVWHNSLGFTLKLFGEGDALKVHLDVYLDGNFVVLKYAVKSFERLTLYEYESLKQTLSGFTEGERAKQIRWEVIKQAVDQCDKLDQAMEIAEQAQRVIWNEAVRPDLMESIFAEIFPMPTKIIYSVYAMLFDKPKWTLYYKMDTYAEALRTALDDFGAKPFQVWKHPDTLEMLLLDSANPPEGFTKVAGE